MLNINLKNVFILSFSALSFSVNANDMINKESLAQECRELSTTVASLVENQKNSCVEKLTLASNQIYSAGRLILKNSYSAAKYELYGAVSTLQYAELSNCRHYIQITHSKYEAQKIKNSF